MRASFLSFVGNMPTFFGTSFDYESEYPIAYAELAKGLSQGHIKRKFHVVEGGIEQAPVALPLLFSGGNDGKLYVWIT